jgi:hypothetical protein
MSFRRRLAGLLMNAANSLSPAATGADGDPSRSALPDPPPITDPTRRTAPEANPAGNPDSARDTAIGQLLETCARAFVPGGRHVRANVMTFTADGLRRAVNRATAFNMAGDADADLEMGATAGASGKAVLYRRAAVADLTLLQITSVPPWGLTAGEQAHVRPKLKSILSVPIFHPAHANGPLLGSLQVDSDLTVEEAGFNKPEAAELMQQFADVLSLMMIGVRVQLGDLAVTTASPMSHSRVQNATQVEPGMYIANSSTSIFLISRATDSWG